MNRPPRAASRPDDEGSVIQPQPQPATPATGSHLNVRRAVVGGAVLLFALLAAAYKLYTDRHAFVSTFERIGAGPIVASTACGLVAVGATFPLWREMLKGMGVSQPWGDGAQVFFVTQLGKYLPGSVWPALMQMEAGERWATTRVTMLWGNLTSLMLNCAVGLSLSCILLPIFDPSGLRQYWWVLLVAPVLLASLHPRVLAALIDRALKLLRRPPVHERIDLGSEMRAAGWATVSWLAFGAQLAILVIASGPSAARVFPLSIGAMALAVPLGVLFLPAPAGAGIREVVLLLILGTIMNPGPALAVVVGSRALLVGCDLILAGAFSLTALRRAGRRGRPAAVEGSGIGQRLVS